MVDFNKMVNDLITVTRDKSELMVALESVIVTCRALVDQQEMHDPHWESSVFMAEALLTKMRNE